MSVLPDHLQALLSARAYPHPVRGVQVVETHVSWVLLTGEFAYKIKRPVQHSFVDQRSLEQRSCLCHEEVRLNLRFAPELYLGVCPITTHAGEARVGGSGPIIEYAVKMRQFSRGDELDHLLATSARAEDRSRFRDLAVALGVRTGVVYCHERRRVLTRRLLERQRRHDDASEADLDVLRWQEERFEAPGSSEGLVVLEGRSPDAAAIEALVALISALRA